MEKIITYAEALRESVCPQDKLNMVDAVMRLGGAFQFGPVEQGCEAAILKHPDYKFVLRLRDKTQTNIFRVAHLLGHYYLHVAHNRYKEAYNGQYLDPLPANILDFTARRHEAQADAFAYSFLLPQKRFRACVDKHTEGNTVFFTRIANEFNVPVHYVRNRYNQLHLDGHYHENT